MKGLALLLAALCLAVMPASAAATFIPGPEGKIAFASGRAPAANDNEARIWVADGTGGTPIQATTQPTGANIQHRHPSWSPDHSKIVYAAGTAFNAQGNYALWIYDLATGQSTEFAPAADKQDRPSWSPDGTRIAYGSNGSLFVKGVAPGSQPVQITNGTTDERPVWSPDGNALYFNRVVGGMRDIKKKSPVTLAGAETDIVAVGNDDWQPAVSPDGSRLCFLRGGQDNSANLHTSSTTGNLADVQDFSTEAGIGDLNCVWSPEGTRILYTRGAFGAGDLYVRDANGTNPDKLENLSVDMRFDGNADWATNFSATCENRNVNVAVNGFVNIPLRCVDPDSGPGIQPPTPDELGSSSMDIRSQPANGNIGSIGANETITYTPKANFRGTDTFTYSGNDQKSDGPPATVTIRVGATGTPDGDDGKNPVLSRLGATRRTFRRGSALPKLSAAKGTTFSFTLSEPARVRFSFARALPGRRAGRRCRPPSRSNRKRRKCTRYKGEGSFTVPGKAGANRLAFEGRLPSRKRLPFGRYRLTVRPTDGAGNRGRARTMRLRIVRR